MAIFLLFFEKSFLSLQLIYRIQTIKTITMRKSIFTLILLALVSFVSAQSLQFE